MSPAAKLFRVVACARACVSAVCVPSGLRTQKRMPRFSLSAFWGGELFLVISFKPTITLNELFKVLLRSLSLSRWWSQTSHFSECSGDLVRRACVWKKFSCLQRWTSIYIWHIGGCPRCFPGALDTSQMPPRAQMPPRCPPQMLSRCFADAFSMLPKFFPDASSILDAPQMPPTDAFPVSSETCPSYLEN